MYDYESLLEHHFQMMCQALLVREFPNVQCMPIAMPDGGRDAVLPDSHAVNTVIFQVKFARNPNAVDNPLEWLKGAVSREIEKVKRLVARGARSYILITNLSGTSHLDTGSIDRLQEYINDVLPVPSRCWWRDDLDRRLDGNYDLKLRYPALLNGPDLLRLLWESAGEDARIRRRRAINSYLGDTYKKDLMLRFRQAELITTRLFDLFVDVPVYPLLDKATLEDSLETYLSAVRKIQASRRLLEPDKRRNDDYHGNLVLPWRERATLSERFHGRVPLAGAADLLLEESYTEAASRIVLEGAPGQGKSTLAQYLAQLQRARLLDQADDIANASPIHRMGPLMLPLKLELRDLAIWMNGLNPWTSSPLTAHNHPRTLEAALAGHITRYSGGASFDVDDLLDVFHWIRPLLILDALDEVADLDDRRRVVEEVQSCLSRLEGHRLNPLVLITSRPSAIANAPAFPDDKFTYLSLAPISPKLAIDYAGKWADARGLSSEHKAESRLVLETKLDAPHMAELAKNTMQLSILLSLIVSRGTSLPDKRTALYDTYIEMFLSREAEKSEIVRNNRERLKDIHGFLGYYLHAKAEGTRSTGRIGADELKEVLYRYLAGNDEPVELLDSLFMGVVERVFALVSRIEGTYEFEVQPLREYFAARYLYDTAPYSPAGQERAGTKPDRFDALAPNPYWTNITRFFAGCFSKGELSDLADRVIVLMDRPDEEHSLYPRHLAASLLQDWVFTQSPRAAKRVVDKAFDNFGIRMAANKGLLFSDATRFGMNRASLTESADSRLTEILWERICADALNERSAGMCSLLQQVCRQTQRLRMWRDRPHESAGKGSHEWLTIGGWMDVLHLLPAAELTAALDVDADGLNSRLVTAIRNGANVDALPEAVRERAAYALLDSPDSGISVIREGSILGSLGAVLGGDFWSRLMSHDFAPERILGLYPFEDMINSLAPAQASVVLNDIMDVLRRVTSLWEQNFSTGLRPWDELTTTLSARFGPTWTLLELALISGSVRAPGERGAGAKELFSDNYPLPQRIRNARRRAAQTTWWSGHADRISKQWDLKIWLASVCTWSAPNVVGDLLPVIDQLARCLSANDLVSLYRVVTRGRTYSAHSGKVIPEAVGDGIRSYDVNTLALISHRLSAKERHIVLYDRLANEMNNPAIASAALELILMELYGGDESDRMASRSLQLLKQCLLSGAESRMVWRRLNGRISTRRPPGDWCRVALGHAWDLPNEVLDAISRYARNRHRPQSVMRIAEQEKWF